MPIQETPVADLLEKYADLENEYSLLDQVLTDTESERDALSEDYGRLLSQLKWTHAMLSILIEEQGGVVQVSKEVLENYELDSQIKVYEDVEGKTYIIEVAFEETNE